MPKTITTTVTVYSFEELSEEAKDTAISEVRREMENDPYCLEYFFDEISSSLKEIVKSLNLRIVSYSYGSSDRNHHIRVYGPAENMAGRKALAYLLQELIKRNYPRPKTFREMKFKGVCGFTGICYDDYILEKIWKYLLIGETFAEAFESLSYDLCKMVEDEESYLLSDENIQERIECGELSFHEDGSIFR